MGLIAASLTSAFIGTVFKDWNIPTGIIIILGLVAGTCVFCYFFFKFQREPNDEQLEKWEQIIYITKGDLRKK